MGAYYDEVEIEDMAWDEVCNFSIASNRVFIDSFRRSECITTLVHVEIGLKSPDSS